jgi:tRNA (guanine37-N1)-methyltransferase
MQFTFLTIFPNLIECYFQDSILKRAVDKNLIEINFLNPRDFSLDKHKKVDKKMVGGGAGMLMTPEPIFRAVGSIRDKNPHIIMLSPVGKLFNQNDAKRLSKKSHILFISGRYEGVDERVIESLVDEVFSIGDFILTGGELASLVLCDSISRNIKGVLGNSSSLEVESFEEGSLEAPSFTKPLIYNGIGVPSEFLKGNHAKISDLKNGMSKCKTKYFRPSMKNPFTIEKR